MKGTIIDGTDVECMEKVGQENKMDEQKQSLIIVTKEVNKVLLDCTKFGVKLPCAGLSRLANSVDRLQRVLKEF